MVVGLVGVYFVGKCGIVEVLVVVVNVWLG